MLVKLGHAISKQLTNEIDSSTKNYYSFWIHVLFTEYLPSSHRASFLPKLTGMTKEVYEGLVKKESRQLVMTACIFIVAIVILSTSNQ